VTSDEPYGLGLAAPASRALTTGPPRGIAAPAAAAIAEFLTGALLAEPHRVGKPLEREFAGYRAARRGPYRIVYRIDEDKHVVHVVRIDHRADVYRPR
jgi:mRNA-degrading endonuclease RelE of RelBE toxin-antitoxin system